MKNKIITTILILGTTTLFAQETDSTLVKEIPIIKIRQIEQKQEIDILKKEIGKLSGKVKNQNFTILQQKKSVVSLTEKNNQQR